MLLEAFALYSCLEDQFSRAIEIHRRLVDAAREFQVLQDSATLNGSSPETSTGENGESDSEESRWKSFVEHESMKR